MQLEFWQGRQILRQTSRRPCRESAIQDYYPTIGRGHTVRAYSSKHGLVLGHGVCHTSGMIPSQVPILFLEGWELLRQKYFSLRMGRKVALVVAEGAEGPPDTRCADTGAVVDHHRAVVGDSQRIQSRRKGRLLAAQPQYSKFENQAHGSQAFVQ